MPNIPRRKIYEKMLELEDILLEMHVLLLNEVNFKTFKTQFESRIEELKKIITEIKVLLIFFIENTKFETEEAFQNTLNIMIKNETELNEEINKNKTFSKKIKANINELQKLSNQNFKFNSITEGKRIFQELDLFNSLIPKILEIRREHIKK